MGGGGSKQGRTTRHFYFGDVVKKKNFGKDVILVCRPIRDKEEYDQWKSKYDRAHDMNKDSLLIPEDYQYRKIKQTGACNCNCGVDAETEMTYEDSKFSLHQQITNRKSKKTYYSEGELLYMLYGLIQGAKQFQRKDLSVGDIRTKNILITNNQELKMVNTITSPDEKPAIDKIIDQFDNTTMFFLAPEEVEFARNHGSSKEKIPNPKTEAWAVGLCILEAATLQNSEGLYGTGRKIKDDLLADRKKQVERKYNHLYPFLESILREDPSRRMSSGECWASMRPYSERITELQPFNKDPSKQNESIRKFLTGGSGRK